VSGVSGASLTAVYERLLAAYGAQGWWPGESAFEVIVGAILIPQTTWPNAARAIANLRSAEALSPDGVRELGEDELATLIRPSGFYRGKSRKLKAFISLLDETFGGDLDRMLSSPGDELRAALLATHGIGPETADSILLYAAHQPYFVIDAYTKRIFSRLGIVPERDDYNDWQAMFVRELPRNVALYNEYHALIVEHGKRTCRTVPLCERCALLDVCATGCANVQERRYIK
jgi:endonuclease-3 related protein